MNEETARVAHRVISRIISGTMVCTHQRRMRDSFCALICTEREVLHMQVDTQVCDHRRAASHLGRQRLPVTHLRERNPLVSAQRGRCSVPREAGCDRGLGNDTELTHGRL